MFAKLFWLMKNKHAFEFEVHRFHLTLYFTCTVLFMIAVNAVLHYAGGYLQYMYLSGPEFLEQNCHEKLSNILWKITFMVRDIVPLFDYI